VDLCGRTLKRGDDLKKLSAVALTQAIVKLNGRTEKNSWIQNPLRINIGGNEGLHLPPPSDVNSRPDS
jgi:hypothetical protein